MRKYVIMGVQGSGKGTQAELLCEAYDLTHIGVGDIFRWNVEQHTKLGALVKRLVADGELVGDDLVESVVWERLDRHDWNHGFVLDGFPRTARQAEFALESFDLDAVINLRLPDAEVRRRLLLRRRCATCGLDGNSDGDERQTSVCGACGGTLVARDDDTPAAIDRRLAEYHARTEPVLAIFERKEFVINVDAGTTRADVFEEIRHRLCLPPTPGTASAGRSTDRRAVRAAVREAVRSKG